MDNRTNAVHEIQAISCWYLAPIADTNSGYPVDDRIFLVHASHMSHYGEPVIMALKIKVVQNPVGQAW